MLVLSWVTGRGGGAVRRWIVLILSSMGVARAVAGRVLGGGACATVDGLVMGGWGGSCWLRRCASVAPHGVANPHAGRAGVWW